MASIDTDALVIELQDMGETNRLAVLLTPEHGIVRAVARGARKSRKRFGGHLDTLRKVRACVAFRRGRGLQSLSECATIEAYPALRSDVQKFALGAYAAELAHGLAREGSRDDRMYRWLDQTLHAITRAAEPSRATAAWLVLGALTVEGFVPDLSACHACGTSLAQAAAPFGFGPETGLRCAACGGRGLSQRVAAWMQAAVTTPSDTGGAQLATGEARAVVDLADRLVRQTFGRPLRSEAFLDDVLGNEEGGRP